MTMTRLQLTLRGTQDQVWSSACHERWYDNNLKKECDIYSHLKTPRQQVHRETYKCVHQYFIHTFTTSSNSYPSVSSMGDFNTISNPVP